MVKSRKILIVDDETSWVEILSVGLASYGFKAIHARNGEEGFKLALGERPDLILLDVVMPKMDGMTVMRKLRQDEWGRDVPIILFTNLKPNEEIMRRVAIDRPAFYLVKTDCEPVDVIGKIKEVLSC